MSSVDEVAADRVGGDRVGVGHPRLGWALGGPLVLGSSAVILVSEIVAVRAIAPYVGVTLETFSAVIGCVLAGISLGSWVGGWLADRVPARRLLVVALALGGVSLVASPRIVAALGPGVSAADPTGALILTAAAFLLPSIVLSAVPPTVLKAIGQGSVRLGSVAGTVSAIGTAGALFGTFGAGYVLVGTFRSGQILVYCGAACLVLAAVTAVVLGRPGLPRTGLATVLVLGAVGGSQVARELPCDEETKYVCLNIEETAPDTYLIRSNIYSSSLTNVADPRDLQFRYVRDMAAVVQAAVGPGDPVSSFGYVGGGGYTLPLYFEATYPGSSHVVYEIDEELVERVAAVLGIDDLATRFPTRIGDARTQVADTDDDAIRFVIGDAFSGISVPWHLTTAEFLEEVDRVLTPEGLYLMNLIDYDDFDLARAEARTFRAVFDEVVLIAPHHVLAGAATQGANIVLVGGASLPDLDLLNEHLGRWTVGSVAVTGPEVDEFIGEASTLTDEFAPVDQLIGRP